jgi:hypothetical protein
VVLLSGFAEELIGCQSFEGLEFSGELICVDEVVEMRG